MAQDIEKLDTLPFKEGRKAFLTRKYGDMWDLRRFDHPGWRSDKNDDPYVKAVRIIKKFIGKQYDKAFSAYCKLVEQYDYHYFSDEFKEHSRWGAEYIVDANGNIQKNKAYTLRGRYHKGKFSKNSDGVIIFKSFDYKEAYVNRFTGEIKTHITFCSNKGDYIYSVISGFWAEFDDPKDKTLLRYIKEDEKQKKLADKRYKKYLKEKEYSFLSNDDIKEIKDKERDLIARDAHGFDENSFKGSEYHGQKRKNK